mgnify:CR=1 FL=1
MTKKILQYAVLGGALLFGAAWLKAMYDSGLYDANLYNELLKHTAASVGLPLAALAALCIVSFLKFMLGTLNLKASGSSSREHRARSFWSIDRVTP